MPGVRRPPRVALLLSLVLAGCSAGGVSLPHDAGRDLGVTPCSGDEECPTGRTCAAGYCQSSGTDGSVDGAIDTAGPPQMSVTPTLLDFGNPILGVEYRQVVTVGNVGGGVLTVTAVNLIEDDASGAFSLDGPTAPFTIDAGGTVALTVVLKTRDDVVPSGSLKLHSDDPNTATADATVDLAAHSKGSPFLGVCVRDPRAATDGGTGACLVGTDGHPLVAFGTVAYGTTAVLDVDLTNTGDGNVPIKVLGVALSDGTAQRLTVRALEVVGGAEQGATLPYYLSIGDPTATPAVDPTRLLVRVAFEAVGLEGAIPANGLVVTSTFTGSPTTIPITGLVQGCVPVVPDGGVPPDGGADPQTDPNNCGRCGVVCSTVHATPECVSGTCVLHCASGWDDCDHDAATGCETDLETTTDHCGACGTRCTNPNGTTACVGGACQPSCSSGTGDCDDDPTNGCETSLLTDVDNCNGCGQQCLNPNGTTACSAGTCAPTCAPGWDRCGAALASGCLTHTAVDVDNCGSCDHVCTNSGGSVSCVGGECQPGCADGYANCDGNAGNGCETPILVDEDHCGGCLTPCSANHVATRACSAGQCTGTCVDGFVDCNHDQLTDGCETDVLNDAQNCGGCGQSACHTTAPPAVCDQNKVVTYSAPGVCSGGACTYPFQAQVCPNGGGCFAAQCTSAPTYEGSVAAFVAYAGTQVYPPNNGTSSSTLGTDFYVETSPKGSEKAVHLFYALNNNFSGNPGTDLVMQFHQWIGSNDQWKATIPPQSPGTKVYWYIRFDHYDGSMGYYSNFGANFSYTTW